GPNDGAREERAAQRHEADQLFDEMMRGERKNLQLESAITYADGKTAWVHWTAWRVPGPHGKPGYSLVTVEDVSERHEVELRLRQGARLEAVGRLAGGVAHDFNNLLTGVILYCDLMLGGLEPGTRLAKYAGEIRSAGLQAAGMVRQLLSVATPQG